MDQVSTIPGKLFYATYQMFKESQIDARGKLILKDLIISNSPSILEAYQNYLKNGTQLTLRSALFNIQKNEKENEKEEGKSEHSRKSKKNPSIKVPGKNIQKLPDFLRKM